MNKLDTITETAAVGREKATDTARWFISASRHGVIAAEQLADRTRQKPGVRQALSLFAGSILIGLGVSLFVHSRLGVPAFDVMLTALRDRLGISLGQAGWLFTGLLLTIAIGLGQKPRLTTVVYTIVNGLAVDVFLNLIRDPQNLAVRWLFVFLGTGAIAIAVALVLHAGLTGGAMELLLKAAQERGIDPFMVRRLLEAAIVVVGVLLGGDLGPATVVYVLTMSPMLRAGRIALEDHRRGRAVRYDQLTTTH